MPSNMTFGLVQNEKPKTFDASRFYDPARHPLRNFPGKLYTIDKGARYKGENRFWTACGDTGTDSLSHQIAIMGRQAGFDYDYGYYLGEKLYKTLMVGQTSTVYLRGTKKLIVTRVR